MSAGGKPSYSVGTRRSLRAGISGPLGSGQPQRAILFPGTHRPMVTLSAAP